MIPYSSANWDFSITCGDVAENERGVPLKHIQKLVLEEEDVWNLMFFENRESASFES